MDKGGANKSVIDQIIEDKDITVIVRQVKYLVNIVGQDHRAVKIITKPTLGFKLFYVAKSVLARVKLMYVIRKWQLNMNGCKEMSFADQFYAPAGAIPTA